MSLKQEEDDDEEEMVENYDTFKIMIDFDKIMIKLVYGQGMKSVAGFTINKILPWCCNFQDVG